MVSNNKHTQNTFNVLIKIKGIDQLKKERKQDSHADQPVRNPLPYTPLAYTPFTIHTNIKINRVPVSQYDFKW